MINFVGIFLMSTVLLMCTHSVFEWDDNRTRRGIVGIVNDSLALEISERCWQETQEGFGMGIGDNTSDGCTNIGLDLVNFQDSLKGLPLLLKSDTTKTTFDYTFAANQIEDLAIIVGSNDGQHKLAKWQFGKGLGSFVSIEWKRSNCDADIEYKNRFNSDKFTTLRFHRWVNEKVLVLPKSVPGEDSCQYGILDMAKGEVNQYRYSQEDNWMSECIDLAYLNDKKVCVKTLENQVGIKLLIQNVQVDSLVYAEETEIQHVVFLGDYLKIFTVSGPRYDQKRNALIYAINNDAFQKIN